MLTAAKLLALADGADHLAALRRGAGAPFSEVQPLEIAASDARAMAQAGNGFATAETMHVAMMLDNERATSEHVHKLTRDALDGAYADRIPDDGAASARIGLADALSEYVETLAGFEEGIAAPSPMAPGRYVALPDMTHALARCAFRSVDWLDLARHYLAEEMLQRGQGAA